MCRTEGGAGSYNNSINKTEILPLDSNEFLSKLMPLTSIPSTILVPTPAKVDVPLNMLLAKLSKNILKSIVGEEKEEEVKGTVGRYLFFSIRKNNLSR